jgi:transposase
MEQASVMHACCCGIDVHKDTVVACVRRLKPGGKIDHEVRTFDTTTRGLLDFGDWLATTDATAAAMESTGVYWKPVWNLLEERTNVDGELIELMLVNAKHVKNVPGRKTDVKDCQWLAQLLSAGLLSPSFVPDRPQRELRDLTRQRVQLIQDKVRVANRLQKQLEDANIKLASVASDVLGKSGRKMLHALIEGKKTPAQMADLAMLKLRDKIPQLTLALNGRVTVHHRFMLKSLLEQVEHLEKVIDSFDRQIEAVMTPLEREAVERLDEIPGFDHRAAEIVLAEIGTDMSRFATAGHLSSWAGMCPGNNQSAGKRRSGRMTDGSKWLKRALNQTGWAAARKKGSYFQAQHRRLTKRRGPKRATMAVGHSQLCVVYEMLKNNSRYADLGGTYFDTRNEDKVKDKMIARLQAMGYKVTLDANAA